MTIHIHTQIIEDSISSRGDRLTTFQLEYPRYIHSELMTHRMFSRNAQSSRAIPVVRQIERLYRNPVHPDPKDFRLNQKGMQAGDELPMTDAIEAHLVWYQVRENAVQAAMALDALGVHKQWVNRLLEPFSTITTVVTATGDYWEHFFGLRDHPDAEPSFQKLAAMMKHDLQASTPVERDNHLPFITAEERQMSLSDGAFLRISAARCARVSYVTHDGRRDLKEDIRLFQQLTRNVPPHASPLEHPALAWEGKHANYWGWRSFRSLWEEHGPIPSYEAMVADQAKWAQKALDEKK